MSVFTPECYIGLTNYSSMKTDEAQDFSPREIRQKVGTKVLEELLNHKNLLDKTAPVIDRTHMGKPILVSPEGWYFNVSHSDTLLLVVLANAEVGIDLEIIKKRETEALNSPLFFSKNDKLFFNCPPNNFSITKLWTIKESWVKLNGLSVWDMHKAPSTKSNFEEGFWTGEIVERTCDGDKRYLWCLRMCNGQKCTPQVLISPITVTWMKLETLNLPSPSVE